MNTYPDLPQWTGTQFNPRWGVQPRYATNGAVRIRLTQTSPKYDFQCYHGIRPQADRDTVVAFYEANRNASFLFTANEDGVQRTMRFAASQPYAIKTVGAKLYDVTENLREV
jgi:hypothetical protein